MPVCVIFEYVTTEKVIKVLIEFIAKNDIPKRIKTDAGKAFKSKNFKQFFREKFIEHITCPLRDHRGNGKLEKMIRTNIERLRTNTKKLVSKEKSGISIIIFALKSKKGQTESQHLNGKTGENLIRKNPG